MTLFRYHFHRLCFIYRLTEKSPYVASTEHISFIIARLEKGLSSIALHLYLILFVACSFTVHSHSFSHFCDFLIFFCLAFLTKRQFFKVFSCVTAQLRSCNSNVRLSTSIPRSPTLEETRPRLAFLYMFAATEDHLGAHAHYDPTTPHTHITATFVLSYALLSTWWTAARRTHALSSAPLFVYFLFNQKNFLAAFSIF